MHRGRACASSKIPNSECQQAMISPWRCQNATRFQPPTPPHAMCTRCPVPVHCFSPVHPLFVHSTTIFRSVSGYGLPADYSALRCAFQPSTLPLLPIVPSGLVPGNKCKCGASKPSRLMKEALLFKYSRLAVIHGLIRPATNNRGCRWRRLRLAAAPILTCKASVS